MISLLKIFRCCALSALIGLTCQCVSAEEPLRVCLVSGSLEYKSNPSLEAFQKYLEEHYNARCTRAFLPGTELDHLPGLENLEITDVMLLFTKRLQLSGDELERIKSYCLSGKPIVGVRTASHAIQTWLELDKEVFGGDYQAHYGSGPKTTIGITEEGKKHPILVGFEPFESVGSLYKNPHVADDVHVLLTGYVVHPMDGKRAEPLAWTRDYKGGRIFYTSLGHPRDFENESFRRMLARALFWTAGRTPQERTAEK